MATQLSIFNAALGHCGTRSRIGSPTEQSPEAISCMTHWDTVRQSALRRYDWNFARRTLSLTLLAVPNPLSLSPAPTSNILRWTYEYLVPGDCLRIRVLNDRPVPSPQAWYELAADVDSTGAPVNVVFCNDPSISAIYTMNHSDPARWDVMFVEAMEFLLASAIAFERTGKRDVAGELGQKAEGHLQLAAAACANESPNPSPAYVSEALQARGYDDGTTQLGQAWPERWG